MKEIDGNKTVYELVKEDLVLKEVLVDLGFTPLNNQQMLETLGRMMSLNNGAKQLGISQKQLADALAAVNYELKE